MNLKTPCGIKFTFIAHPEIFYSFSLGFLLFKDFCLNEINEAVPQVKFYEEVRSDCFINAFISKAYLNCTLGNIKTTRYLRDSSEVISTTRYSFRDADNNYKNHIFKAL